jgi:hypothetical protein
MARSRLVITAIDIELHIEGQFVASWDKLPMFNYPKELKPAPRSRHMLVVTSFPLFVAGSTSSEQRDAYTHGMKLKQDEQQS